MHNKEDEYREAVVWSSQLLGLQDLLPNENMEFLERKLADYLDELIVSDFKKLVGILYRIDISQESAVAALAEFGDIETAGETMAKLIINRQKEKIYYRKLYGK